MSNPIQTHFGSIDNVIITDSSGYRLKYTVWTGEVLDTRSLARSETTVSGSGGANNSSVTVSSHTTHWTVETIFLRSGDDERSFKLRDNIVPVRPGNRVSFVAVGKPSGKRRSLIALYNHDTKNLGAIGGNMKGTVLPKYVSIAYAAAIVAFILPLYWWAPQMLVSFVSFVKAHPIKGTMFGLLGLMFSGAAFAIFGGILTIINERMRIRPAVRRIINSVSTGKDLSLLGEKN